MTSEAIHLPNSKLKKLVSDPGKSAAAVNLFYISGKEEGIGRIRKGTGFVYRLHGRIVKDKAVLQRIKSLVIPPAWEDVWICDREDGHLQATGMDARGRKQYRYHPLWSVLRNQTKFYHLYEFGKALPAIREQLKKDLRAEGLPLQKVLAAVVSIIATTGVRIGNGAYEKLYGSYGLSTLKNKHAAINGNKVRFTFKGKKGVAQDISFTSRKLANIVKQCRDIPGRELFQFYDEQGGHHAIDSGMINEYIHTISGGNFTAKDFRTWTGTVHALLAFNELGFADTQTETKRRIVAALDQVSMQLGNTRTVCRKYYVHPNIIALYECRELEQHLLQLHDSEGAATDGCLSKEEELVMKLIS